MGGSSNSQQQEERDAKGFTKVCFYEILGIEKSATDKDIKIAYKKSSLKWHPDKNPNEDTTEKFQMVNEAYQCLSDPQSRSWYDSHRDQILRGKDTDNMEEKDETYITKSRLKPFFKESCHSGYSPSAENNFYTVYDALFRKLDKEEEMEEDVSTKHFEAPPFGQHYATSEEVFAFYDWWKFFTTNKPMSYADMYNPKEAPNRRVKRIIETENKKERQKERVKFNEVVRELVTKLMDKDPRYKKFAMIQQQEKDAKRKRIEDERQAKKDIEAERLRVYREERAAYYAKQEEEAIARGDFEEVFVEEFRCEICKKVFKKEA